jgi:hypothetical protein
MWAMFNQWPKIPKIFIFETLYIVIGHSVLVTFEHFIYIEFGRKINCLDILYESLNFFFHETKSQKVFKYLLGIFKLVQI